MLNEMPPPTTAHRETCLLSSSIIRILHNMQSYSCWRCCLLNSIPRDATINQEISMLMQKQIKMMIMP
jgi:hypothetical protein